MPSNSNVKNSSGDELNHSTNKTSGKRTKEAIPTRLPFQFMNLNGNQNAYIKWSEVFSKTGYSATGADDPTIINLDVGFDSLKLYQQGYVFSSQYLQCPDSNNPGILGRSDSSWEDTLIKTYVYSYAKALILGNSNTIIEDRYVNSYLLVGHCLFYDVLRARRFTFSYDLDLQVNYNVRLSHEKYDQIISSLKISFPFLEECLFDEPGIGINFVNVKYEKILESLGTNIGRHSHGFLAYMLKSGNSSHPNFLHADTIPLGNCFFGKDFDHFYICHAPNVCTSFSHSWCRAVFLQCSDENTHRNYMKIEPVNYRSFIKYDAGSIVGSKIKIDPTDGRPDKVIFVSASLPTDPSDDGEPSDISFRDSSNGFIGIKDRSGNKIPEPKSPQGEDIKSLADYIFDYSDKLNLRVRFPSGNMKNKLPFDIDKQLDLEKLVSDETLRWLIRFGTSRDKGIRFGMHNFKITNGGIETIDGKIKLIIENASKTPGIYFDDLISIVSMGWLAKTQNLCTFDDYSRYLSGFSFKYTLNQNFSITIHPGGTLIMPPITKFSRGSGKF